MTGMEMAVRLRSDGTAVFPGIDWESGSTAIEIWHEDEDYIVFKIPAGKHWVSITEGYSSHPGKYLVAKFETKPGDSTQVPNHWDAKLTQRYARVKELFEMPVSVRGRNSGI